MLGQEIVVDRKHEWLAADRERLHHAHQKCRAFSEKKPAERIALQNSNVFCTLVVNGQLVYLRHRPLRRNTIKDAWSHIIYKVVDIQGTTSLFPSKEPDQHSYLQVNS